MRLLPNAGEYRTSLVRRASPLERPCDLETTIDCPPGTINRPKDARLPGAEAVERAAGAHVEAAAGERRGGVDVLAEIVDAEDVPFAPAFSTVTLPLTLAR